MAQTTIEDLIRACRPGGFMKRGVKKPQKPSQKKKSRNNGAP